MDELKPGEYRDLSREEYLRTLERACVRQPDLKQEPSRLERFDTSMRSVTQERGAVYGHPKDDFDRAAKLKAVVAECKDPLARHALEMICVKIARLINSPEHLDSWIDIAGYARTGVMATEK